MLPFLLVAFAIGSGQSLRWQPKTSSPIAVPAPVILPAPVSVTAVQVPAVSVTPSAPAGDVPSQPGNVSVAQGESELIPASAANLTDAFAAAPAVVTPSAAGATLSASRPVEIAALTTPEPDPAALGPVTDLARPAAPENMCVADPVQPAEEKRLQLAALGAEATAGAGDPIAFGMALAASAREQLDDFTVYTDKYRSIAYPMGDVPQFYGVCTDVLVRAYRGLGVDLQALVHQSKLGSGDTNIDHRRVGTLQKFFSKYGVSLPISEFSEDYWPGDIISYYRPQNAHSRSHIAVVSDVIGPSGNFMIIHNRGWGPQQEDALFVDQMTGHYRYSAMRKPAAPVKVPVVAKSKPAASPAQLKQKAAAPGARAALSPESPNTPLAR